VSGFNTHLGAYNSFPGLEFHRECATERWSVTRAVMERSGSPGGAGTWQRSSA